MHEEEQLLQRLRAGERIDHYETVRMTQAGRPIDVSVVDDESLILKWES
jgi:hypothetical protein